MPIASLLVLCTILVGCGREASATDDRARDSRSMDMSPSDDSALVQAGGERIFVVTRGPADSLAIVFVGGLGEDHDNWRELQDSLSRTYRTVSYDRAGFGKSPPPHRLAKDARAMSDELHAVIAHAVHGRFIIVSHSLGCTISRVYEQRHPDGLAGAVYIDPPPDQEALEHLVGPALWRTRDSAIKAHVPPMDPARAEEFRLQNESYREAAATGRLREMPRVLFTATLTYPDFPASQQELLVKRQSHAQWIAAMPGTRQVVVPSSRHYVHNDVPGLVVSEIRKVVAASERRSGARH
jgi:pimeloyl-ACP methyl ester carboxylesterase